MELDRRARVVRTHTMSDGARVRLRLARARDEEALRALLARCAPHRDDVDAGRLARFDPRHAVVIFATALVDSSQEVVGVGAVGLDQAEPPDVVVDEHHDGELAELLQGALEGRLSAYRRR
jgi:hypothetical protein